MVCLTQEIASKGLVYAEVGQQQQQSKQSTFVDLDDNRVEYSQLQHDHTKHSNLLNSNMQQCHGITPIAMSCKQHNICTTVIQAIFPASIWTIYCFN